MFIHDAALKAIFGAYDILFSRGVEISGDLPLPGGARIIAANHTNASDTLRLPYLLPGRTHCLLQNGLFAIPLLGWLFGKTGQVCVDREHGRAAYLQTCRLLRAGETVALFPEARLCPREARLPAKSGAVRLALETGAPLIPLGFYVRPQDLLCIRLPGRNAIPGNWQIAGKCYARFGPAWMPDPARPVALQTEELMERIYALVDQLAAEVTACASPISLNPIRQS